MCVSVASQAALPLKVWKRSAKSRPKDVRCHRFGEMNVAQLHWLNQTTP
jgi:hypothetical protein